MVQPFQTPSNEKSFSGLIDAALLATGKPGALINAVQYANMTVRECQAFGLFAQDLLEDVIVSTTENPYIWYRPFLFRRARTFKYLSCGEYPKLLLPGRIQKHELRYYYAADNYFVFNGVGLNDQIGSAIYYWSKPLVYSAQLGVNTTIFPGGPYPIRPAFYDLEELKWQYLNTDETAYEDTTGNTVEDTARQKAALNWLVAGWYDLILSGTKAKIWNQAGDSRSANEYSLYKQMQKLLQTTMNYESENM